MNPSAAETGLRLAHLGRFAEALPLLGKANGLAPLDTVVLHAYASLLLWAGRGREAADRYRVAADGSPDDASVLGGWARCLLRIGEIKQATALIDRMLDVSSRSADVDADAMLGEMLDELDDPEADCTILQKLAARHGANSSLQFRYSKALKATDRLDAAQAAFERYRVLWPEDPQGLVELGLLASHRGESARAIEHFRDALQLDPDHAPAWWESALAQGGRLDQPTFDRIRALAQATSDPERASAFHDILARHHDRAGEFDAAAEHVARANSLQAQCVRPEKRYDAVQREREIAVTIGNVTATEIQRLCGAGNDDPRPVFVIGLPRCGTTLLEQMLASHPGIVSIGEQTIASASFKRAVIETIRGGSDTLLPAAVANAARWHLQQLDERMHRLALRADAARVIDKLPDNYVFAGWLAIAFPKAAILHCLRDPRDVALSCWQTQFSKITWSHELDHIAHRIEQHRRVMRHWRATIGPRLTEIRYERLVHGPEVQIRRALDAIGLDWDERVLAFEQRKGLVKTASRQQVRESLHARSVGRWRNYEAALRPIMPRLEAIVEQDAREATPDTAWPMA